MHGFEIKVSRGDWLRELKNPGKADELIAHCDRWWIVAAESAIVANAELPPTWGLFAPAGGRLAVVVQAPKLEPQPLDRAFVAALLRRAAEAVVPTADVERAVETCVRDRIAAALAVERSKDGSAQEYERLIASVAKFEAASGVRIDRYSAERNGPIGAAVKLVLAGGLTAERNRLARLRVQAQEIVASIDTVLREAAEEGSTA